MDTPDTPIILFIGQDASRHRRLRTHLRRRGAVVQWMPHPDQPHSGPHPDLVVADTSIESPGPDELAEVLRRRHPDAWLLLERAFRDPEAEPVLPRVLWTSARSEPTLERRIEEILKGRLEAEPPPAPGAFVVCVDDDRQLLESLRRLLTRSGYRVGTFTDPERALESAGDHRPDLAIVDVMMPGMSGLKLAEELKTACGPEVPVVLLTARADDRTVAEGFRKGASYYLTKPCAPRRVLDVVDYLVGDLDRPEREQLETEL